jgi:hypothetical protein
LVGILFDALDSRLVSAGVFVILVLRLPSVLSESMVVHP